MQRRGRKEGLGRFFNPANIISAFLAGAIVYVVISIVGFSTAQAGNKLTLLSATQTRENTLAGSQGNRTNIYNRNDTAEKDSITNPVEDWQIVRMRVTGYCACSKCCGKWSDGITASGRPVTANRGRFVAAPAGLVDVFAIRYHRHEGPLSNRA